MSSGICGKKPMGKICTSRKWSSQQRRKGRFQSNIDAPPSAPDDGVDDRYQNVTIRFIGVFDTVGAMGDTGLLGQISW
jgi:hypothetical protein